MRGRYRVLVAVSVATLAVVLGVGASTGAGGQVAADATLARASGSLGAFTLATTAVVVVLAGRYAALVR